MATNKPYRISAMFLWFSAVLTAIGPFVGSSTRIILVAVVLACLALGLMRGKTWVAYIAFLVVGLFGCIAFGWIWSISGPPVWWVIPTTAICCLTASLLLVVLWRPKGETRVSS